MTSKEINSYEEKREIRCNRDPELTLKKEDEIISRRKWASDYVGQVRGHEEPHLKVARGQEEEEEVLVEVVVVEEQKEEEEVVVAGRGRGRGDRIRGKGGGGGGEKR